MNMIEFVQKGSALTYKHMLGHPTYKLKAICKEDFSDGLTYWKCKVLDKEWYEEVILTPGDFESFPPRAELTKV